MIADWFPRVVMLKRFLNATYRSLHLLQIIIRPSGALQYMKALFALTKTPLFLQWWSSWGRVCILGFLFRLFQRCPCSTVWSWESLCRPCGFVTISSGSLGLTCGRRASEYGEKKISVCLFPNIVWICLNLKSCPPFDSLLVSSAPCVTVRRQSEVWP